MCDYSIQNKKTRAAVVDDKLVVQHFGMTTRGFAPVGEPGTAVCLLPGTELAFDNPVVVRAAHYLTVPYNQERVITELTARFRQVNRDNLLMHHDALEFGDGQFVMLTQLADGQRAIVLQLPAAPKTEAEAKDQERLAIVG